MFGQTRNQLTLTLRLEPAGPILMKAADDSVTVDLRTDARSPAEQMTIFSQAKAAEKKERDKWKKAIRDRRKIEHEALQRARRAGDDYSVDGPTNPANMRFVMTSRNGEWQPYLPGASLKGVLRSHAEAMARAWTLDGQGACNPLSRIDDDDPPCWHPFGDPDANEDTSSRPAASTVYPLLCAICTTFGSPYLASRLQIGDGYLVRSFDPRSLSRRDGVGIDRRRGAAADGAKYDFEFLDSGQFDVPIQLRNFELWQVGLLAHLLYTLAQTALPIGYGTHRGLGRVTGSVRDLTLHYYGQSALTAPEGDLPLWGLGQMVAQDGRLGVYQFLTGDAPVLRAEDIRAEGSSPSLRRSWRILDPDVLWQRTGPLWSSDTLTALAQRRAAALASCTPTQEVT